MERVAPAARADEPEHLGAMTLFFQGEQLRQQKEPVKALACYAAAERLARSVARHETVLTCLERRIDVMLELHDFEQARRTAAEGLTYVRLIEQTGDEMTFLRLLARVLREQGTFDEALEVVFECLELARDQRRLDDELTLVADLAEITLAAGDAEGALRHASSGLNRAIMVKDSARGRVFALLAARARRRLNRRHDGRSLALAIGSLPPLPLPFDDDSRI